MFRIETTDAARLTRIVAAGAGAIVVGLLLVVINVTGPVVGGDFSASNLVFGVFGLLVVLLAAHPTYEAAQRLDRR